MKLRKIKGFLITFLFFTGIMSLPVVTHAIPVGLLISATSNTYTSVTIDIVGGSGANHFSPDTITIHSGDTVYWRNLTNTSHSAISDAHWDTGTLGGSNVSQAYTFFALGTTGYYCKNHGTSSYGAIIVLPSTASATRWEFFSKSEPVMKQASLAMGDGPFGIEFEKPESKSNIKPLIQFGGSIEISGQILHKK